VVRGFLFTDNLHLYICLVSGFYIGNSLRINCCTWKSFVHLARNLGFSSVHLTIWRLHLHLKSGSFNALEISSRSATKSKRATITMERNQSASWTNKESLLVAVCGVKIGNLVYGTGRCSSMASKQRIGDNQGQQQIMWEVPN